MQHTKIGFDNPFLACEKCRNKVPYWHDPDLCGCNGECFNYPCEHTAGVFSTCETWSPVGDCSCKVPCT